MARLADLVRRYPSPFSIAIVGAGIGGITLSIALATHTNFQITIYESRPAFSEIGAGVGFGLNACRAMSLISPSVAEAWGRVKATNLRPEKDHVWFDFRDGMSDDFDLIAELLNEKDFLHTAGSRAQFLDELVKLIPADVKIEFSKKVADVQEVDGGKMKIVFADGSHVIADAVVGCDGVRSKCRQILLGDDDETSRAVYTGKYAYRKVVPMKKAVEIVDEDMEMRNMIVGRGGHIVMMPIMNGAAANFVVFRDAEGTPWTDRRWVIPSSRDEVMQDFKDWGKKVLKILELIENPEKWALFEHLPASIYAKGNFCLLGDAAHASTPHCGAGAGFAIEDAYVLSGLLTPDLISSAADIKIAFQAYDRIRRPRSQELVRRSRANGMLLDLQNPDGGEMTHEKMMPLVEDNQSWVWTADIAKMLTDARDVFKELKGE
ncbi:mannitol 1-phosphate dehydrogenase protein [Rutstroemia sp. NJR-2017a BBW]|nr:mannitol 1-phosphate dehydrogenase protein [Rutstroemia sp. NJR-2017a BBW]